MGGHSLKPHHHNCSACFLGAGWIRRVSHGLSLMVLCIFVKEGGQEPDVILL